MERREWAEREVEKLCKKHQYFSEPAIALAFKTEHARAVSIVKRAKALQLHGLRDTDTNEFLEGYEAACVDILAALTKGRA